MDQRAPPPQLQLPSAVVPLAPRKRRSPRISSRRRQATIPPPAAALPVPVVPSAPRRNQISAPTAAAEAADDLHDLMLLAHIAVSQADAEVEASSPPPAPAANEHSSPPLLPPAAKDDEEKAYAPPPLLPPAAKDDEEKPYAPPPPPLPPAAKDDEDKPYAPPPPPLPPLPVNHQNPSSAMSIDQDHGHAATKASAEDCKKAACPQDNAAGSSKWDQSRGDVGVGVASPAAGASLQPPQPQPGDDDEDEELEPGEIPPEKPAAGCNADSARGSSSPGKEETAAGEEAKTGVVERDGDGNKAAAKMSAAEEKRMREVFVGGLSKDATEWDVRAALWPAGEITQVRMIRDKTTGMSRDYCFVAYRDAAMASKAVAELANVKILGKPCRLAVPEGSEKISSKVAQRDPTVEDYNRIYEQIQPSPELAVHSSYVTSWDHHASYVVPPVVTIPAAGYYYTMYHDGNIVYLPSPPDLHHGLTGSSGRNQMGQSGSSRPAGKPHRSRN